MALRRLESMMPSAWEERHLASGLLPERLVIDRVDEVAARDPGRTAVIDTGRGRTRILTYGELKDVSERLAQGLVGLGVGPGDVVSYQLPNWWEFVALTLAVTRIGAVASPLMPIFRERELAFMIGQSRSRVLVVPDRFRNFAHAELATGLRPALPDLEHVVVVGEACPAGCRPFAELLAASPDRALLQRLRPEPRDVTQLLYTSGTSGEPKGVLHTHRTLLGALRAHVRHFGLGPGDTVFVPSPVAHQTGFLYGMYLALDLGAAALYQDIWDPGAAMGHMNRHGATFVQAATPFLSDLVEVARRTGERPKALRIFVATGAPVPRVLAQQARHELGAAVVGAWGSTETCLVTAGAPSDPPERTWQTDGRVLAGMGMRVVDEDGRELPAGQEGRLQVDTPAMFVGYLDRPEGYARAFAPDGWFDTGDLARIDADGFMRICGRVKDVINRGGEKVPVVEVEELLYRHPAVADVAVVAMPDPRLGERACAFVVPRPGRRPTLAELVGHLERCGMAKVYWPERLELVEALPRTPSGKVQKYLLREAIAAKLRAEQGAREASGN